ncbi:D-lactate dehydrogenase [Pelomyxa schiedti]|nr:D-lactate dehydrogenase [Pelomyxa schiedti]
MVVKVAVFSYKQYDEVSFRQAETRWREKHNGTPLMDFTFFSERLNLQTASKATGFDAVCIFVNDNGSAQVVEKLHGLGIKLILLRCAGFNNVDLETCKRLGVVVMRVPRYSPHAVAEHAITLMLALTRNLHKSYFRVKNYDFRLNGLLGFDIAAKTVGVIGCGAIGKISAQILKGFGARVLAYDPFMDAKWASSVGVISVPLQQLFQESDIITIHIPLSPETKYLINANSLSQMKNGVMIVNTSRGGLIKAKDMVAAILSGKVGFLGIDVYENETPFFFEDCSGSPLSDPLFAQLLAFPNVICTAHQAFFTEQAMDAISNTTLNNAHAFVTGKAEGHPNQVLPPKTVRVPRAKL